MVGRRRLAIGTGMGTVVLVILLTTVAQTVWFEGVVLLWWAALTVRGWYLARGRSPWREQGGKRRQRVITRAVTVPVLLAIGLLRFDAARIEHDTAEARRDGDCPRALAELDGSAIGWPTLRSPPASTKRSGHADCCGRPPQLATALTGVSRP